MYQEDKENIVIWSLIVSFFTGIIIAAFIFLPKYGVYRKELKGKAMLKEAEWSKKIKVEEAKAKLESAKLESEAEIERSRGLAEANKIVGDSLKGNEEYLRYLYIEGLKEDNKNQIIYVPTEAGLPILEAGRQSNN